MMRTKLVVAAFTMAVLGIGLLAWFRGATNAPLADVLSNRTRAERRQSTFNVRCGEISHVDEIAGAERRHAIDRDIYTAIVQAHSGRLPPLLVVESITIPIVAVPSRNGITEFPSSLRLVAVNGSRDCFPLTTDRLPPGTRLVDPAQLRPPENPRGFWPAFRQQFDDADGWWAFSAVRRDRGEHDALVFYEQRCEGGCGEGAWVWLHRDASDTPWRIMKRVTAWQG